MITKVLIKWTQRGILLYKKKTMWRQKQRETVSEIEDATPLALEQEDRAKS